MASVELEQGEVVARSNYPRYQDLLQDTKTFCNSFLRLIIG
jgi:hypothetical protein